MMMSKPIHDKLDWSARYAKSGTIQMDLRGLWALVAHLSVLDAQR